MLLAYRRTLAAKNHRRKLLLVAGIAALVIAIPALAAQITYYSGGLPSGGGAHTTGYASRDWNRVYRPTAYTFCLAYNDANYVCDAWSNPFVDNRNATSAQSWCQNSSTQFVSNVTCQTTTP